MYLFCESLNIQSDRGAAAGWEEEVGVVPFPEINEVVDCMIVAMFI